MMPWLGSWANWYTPHPLPLFPQMALSSSCIPSHTRTRTRTVFAESPGHRIRVGSIQSVQLQPFTWSGQWTSAFSWSMELCPHLRHKHTHKHTHTHTHTHIRRCLWRLWWGDCCTCTHQPSVHRHGRTARYGSHCVSGVCLRVCVCLCVYWCVRVCVDRLSEGLEWKAHP